MIFRMFLDQRRVHRLILFMVIIDVFLAKILDGYHDARVVLPLAILYLLNIVAILAVYRFWKLPIFEWDDSGFVVYGISPFKKEFCSWKQLEYACFRELEESKGKQKEYLVLHYVLPNGLHKTNMVPMYMVGFADKIKEDFLKSMKRKGISPQCPPGL